LVVARDLQPAFLSSLLYRHNCEPLLLLFWALRLGRAQHLYHHEPSSQSIVIAFLLAFLTMKNARRVGICFVLCIVFSVYVILRTNRLFHHSPTTNDIIEDSTFMPPKESHSLSLHANRLWEEMAQPVENAIKKQQDNRPTFLWGIPTMMNDTTQRQLLRETYLSYYNTVQKNQENRICSLADLQKKRSKVEQCQIVYVFVVGGNPKGPTELVAPNASFPITMKPPSTSIKEDDVVFLNIRENLEDGKSQTLFKYGLMIADEYGLDYVVKVDSDTLVFIPNFLEYAKETIPSKPAVPIYGGIPLFNNSCDPNVTDTHSCPLPLLGPHYMSGELYFMSRDVARFITSSNVDRAKLAIRHEDVDIGNYVFSHPLSIQSILVNRTKAMRSRGKGPLVDRFRTSLWAHTYSETRNANFNFKNLNYFRSIWRLYLVYDAIGDRFNLVCTTSSQVFSKLKLRQLTSKLV
jgi:hypothetical protein